MSPRIKYRPGQCSRRAQSEIAGLLIIVVMLVFIMLFAYRLIQPAKDTSNERVRTADALIGAMLQTDARCSNSNLQDLLKECMRGDVIVCYNGSRSCAYAHGMISQMLAQTLDTWNWNYKLTISSPNTQPMVFEHGPPIGDNDERDSVPPFPIPLNNGVNGQVVLIWTKQ